MKFTIRRKELLQSIQDVTSVISSKTVIPILSGLKIDVHANHIVLTGSNSDITIQRTIPNIVDEEEIITKMEKGSIVLPVPQFPEIISKLPEDIVDITVGENYKTVISSGTAVFTLYGQNSEEYPVIQHQQVEPHFSYHIKQLKSIIKQTVFAVSSMETRPVLTGINVIIKEKEITFTATDSHRLAMRTSRLEDSSIDEANIVIPGKSMQELQKVLDEKLETVQIAILNNQIVFFTDHLFFSSRLLSGNYPDTSRLIPNNSETKIQIYTRDFIQTIERAALLSNREQNNVIDLETKENNNIQISGKMQEVGEVTEQLPAISVEGNELKISFSSKYMLDSLKAMDHETVIINFTGAMRPFVIKTPDDESILQLILPVKTF